MMTTMMMIIIIIITKKNNNNFSLFLLVKVLSETRKMFKPLPYIRVSFVRLYASHKILSDKIFWYSPWRV